MRKIMVWNILVIMTDIGGHGMIVSIIIAYMEIMVDSIFIILVVILRIICFDFR